MLEKTRYDIEEQSPGILLSHAEMKQALELLVQRLEAIHASCTNSFPLYSPGIADQWMLSPGGSWIGGYWGACWWLRSRITGALADRRNAVDICQRLSPKITTGSINRNPIFWYGAALGDLWFGDVKARSLASASISAIAASCDPKMHCVPLGREMGGGKDGNQLISVDSLAPLVQLLSRSEDSAHHQIARTHASTVSAACGTGNGAFHPGARFADGRFQPVEQAGEWSRGQAWAMLGLSRAAALWGEPYLTCTVRACEYWKRSRPAPLPLNRLDDPSGPADPSSSIIASLAMLALAELLADGTDGTQWHAFAQQEIAAIVRSDYFTGHETGSRAKSGDPPSGIFWGCCYKTSDNKEEMVESAWGSFFLMAALCVLLDMLKPDGF
ncbi:MAG: glucuronyl hydrolase [Nitrosospira multiformis]|nr:glucuronyl hydrolase [Nitrosospira multiformis]